LDGHAEMLAPHGRFRIFHFIDANLDEALDESFPASDPPSMTQPRTGADLTQRKPKRRLKGQAIQRGTRRSRASPTEQSPSRVGKSGQWFGL